MKSIRLRFIITVRYVSDVMMIMNNILQTIWKQVDVCICSYPNTILQQLVKSRQNSVRMAGVWKWTYTKRRDVNRYNAKFVLNKWTCGFWHPWSTVDLTIKWNNRRSNKGLRGNNEKGLIKKHLDYFFCAHVVWNK